MVAPALIAGVTALGGIVIAAVADAIGKAKKVYGVTWISGRQVEGKGFSSLDDAMKYQDQMAAKGIGSIIVENTAGSYKGLRAVRAVAPGGRKIRPDALRRMSPAYRHPTGAYTGPQEMGVGARNFDTNEEALEVTQATTRLPTPEWAKRAKDGPYPETNPGHQDYMPEAPLFRQTTSSHEWKSDVDTWAVPDKFFPGRQGMPGQPEELVVEQALQYPERAGGPSSSS